MPQWVDLSGRVVMITGASSGIGYAMALSCAQAGAAVAAAARRTDRLQELVKTIEREGGRAFAVEMDVTRESSIAAAFDAAQAVLGPIDSVLANAGINIDADAMDITPDQFDQLMHVNTRGMLFTAREAAKRMMAAGSAETRRGRIVLVASIAGVRIQPAITPYSASKAATIMLGKGLARQWVRKGINVNMLCPGYMVTEINDDFFASEQGRKMVQKFPRRAVMQVEDLAPIVTLLLSDGARAMTGSVIVIDEGQAL
jgi:NAD(P)-dependent dehydrogenase (short-subunit alcohol dehydrogenase family)